MAAENARATWADRLWGRMIGLEPPVRIVALAFVAAAIVALSFCQLSFWPLCNIDGKPVYLMLVLGPLLMGALMFGPIAGALFGLFTGAVLFAHATFFALDFYEVYYMAVANTFALHALVGLVAGWLFSIVVRRTQPGGVRNAAIVAVCLALSFAASGLVIADVVLAYGGIDVLDYLREYLFNSPLGVAIQALVDAAAMVVLCLVTDWAVERLMRRGGNRRLLSVFRNWMLLVSAVVFMFASAFIFTVTTAQAQDKAAAEMESEVSYLTRQLSVQHGLEPSLLLGGYDSSIDGWVVITDRDGVIVATDDDGRYPTGSSLMKLLDYEVEGASAEEVFETFLGTGETSLIQAVGENGDMSMDIAFLALGSYSEGYIAMVRPSSMVYANRLGTMASSTLLAFLLLAAISVVATVLLNRVVVRHIDETNDSLGKITGGNLNERVSVRDSREFMSLSSGINSTVSALRDTIEEVQQKNAQELLTAKAIQESSLPREFPPFPDIDKFDLYASMKTAKEVGGDFYDFFLIGDAEDKLGFVMADVSGKGIPAALFMMTAKTQIENYMMAGLGVGEAVDAANHQLCIGNDAGMFVTAWLGVLDYNTGLLTYVNAGHNPPLMRRDGAWEWMRNVSGMPLGLFDGIPYDQYELQLQPGDMLYAYTDGVTEAMNLEGELFHEDRLEQTLYKYGKMNPRSVGVGVRRAITEFTLDCEQSDDITMLILKYGVPPEKRAVMILDANVNQLVHVFNFIHEELKRRSAPKSVYNPLDIAAEELFVNVCHYAYPDATPDNPGEVRIGFEYDNNPPSLTVTISDDGIPYNPLEKPDAATADEYAGIDDVPIGGLGILMAKNSVDDMSYERVDGSNVLTFVKRW